MRQCMMALKCPCPGCSTTAHCVRSKGHGGHCEWDSEHECFHAWEKDPNKWHRIIPASEPQGGTIG